MLDSNVLKRQFNQLYTLSTPQISKMSMKLFSSSQGWRMKRSPRLLFSRTGDLTLPFYQISLFPVLVSAKLDLLSSVVKYTLGFFFLYCYFFSPFFLNHKVKKSCAIAASSKGLPNPVFGVLSTWRNFKNNIFSGMKPPNLTRRRLAVECLTSLTTANYKPRSPTDPNSPRALHLSPTLRYVPAK